MSLRTWFRPPRHLLALFALVTLLPSVLLIAFGWRMLQQDRTLERQQQQLRRGQAADLAVAALEQTIADAERPLGDPSTAHASPPAEGAVMVVFDGANVAAFPRGRVLYYPVAPPLREAPAHSFDRADALEYRARDFLAAARLALGLSRSSDPAVRAGALVREARNLGKAGRPDEALRAYHNAAKITDAAVAGVPSDLFARWARCNLLAELHRDRQLREEANELSADLERGLWALTRTTYELHAADARKWAKTGVATRSAATTLTRAIEELWRGWQRARDTRSSSSGRDTAMIDGVQVTRLWIADEQRLATLVATPEFVERQWLSRVTPLLKPQNLRAILRDRAARTPSSAVVRPASESGLPWAVVIEPADPANDDLRSSRREWVWIGGLAVLALLSATGTCVVARAVARELAVARLQADFVAAVSHEFRTPLTTIRQLTEMLTDGRTTEERRGTYYQALARQTERLRRLVESLLDFGRMEAGTSPYRREPFDPSLWIRDVVQQFEQDPASRGYRIHVQMSEGMSAIEGDREALTSALWNLLDNAVKYSPGCPNIRVDVTCSDRRLAIAVRDQGLGIPREEQQDIFRRFVRGARAKAENIKGTGIGLAMVQHIITAHGGEVRVESEPGEGSTFTVRLPLTAGTERSFEADECMEPSARPKASGGTSPRWGAGTH